MYLKDVLGEDRSPAPQVPGAQPFKNLNPTVGLGGVKASRVQRFRTLTLNPKAF